MGSVAETWVKRLLVIEILGSILSLSVCLLKISNGLGSIDAESLPPKEMFRLLLTLEDIIFDFLNGKVSNYDLLCVLVWIAG